jgi:hypothetical protein
MKYFKVIALTTLVTLGVTSAYAQRDAYTSSARAAYSAPNIKTELGVKKSKRKAQHVHAKKARKIKMRDPKSARIRRRSLHF